MRFSISLSALTAILFASACVRYAPEESVVGDYLSGRFAARVNDIDAAASAFAGAQSEAPGAAEILRDAFFFELAAGNTQNAMPLAEKIITKEEYGDDGLARMVLASRALKLGRYERVSSLLSEGVDARYLQAAKRIFEAWAIEGEEGPAAAHEFLLSTGEDSVRGFDPLHLAFFADKAGWDEDALAAYQIAVRTLGGPVGRAAYGAFLERSGDEIAAREYYEFLSQAVGPERQVAQQGLARLDRGSSNNAYKNTTPAEGAAIAIFSLGAAIQEQAATQRDAAEEAGFKLGEANYNLPLLLMQLSLYLDPDFDDSLRFAGTIMNIYGENDRAMRDSVAHTLLFALF